MKNGEDKHLKISLFRCGDSDYAQGKTTLALANDLTDWGIDGLRENTRKMLATCAKTEEFILVSSSFGRCLHSAKIINQELHDAGFEVDEKKIMTLHFLKEIENFIWSHFVALVEGGGVLFAGKCFNVDAKLTNPQNFSLRQYYSKGCFNKFSQAAKESLPWEYVQIIQTTENFASVVTRLMGVFQSVRLMESKKNKHLVLVTHNALAGFLTEVFSGGKEYGIDKGECIELVMNPEGLFITQIGTQKNGHSEIDIFAEYQRRFANIT